MLLSKVFSVQLAAIGLLPRGSRNVLLALILLATAAPSSGLDREALQAFLDNPARDLNDRLRDEQRKPVAVMEFLGIDRGMQVLEVYAAGGYYAVVLAGVVGPTGRVYAQNSPRALGFEEDRSDTTADSALNQKIAALKLDNIQRIDQRFSDVDLADNSLDAVLVSQIFHDYYNRSPAAAASMLQKIKAVLKPGGVLGIIDHYGEAGRNNARLHRVVKSDVIAALELAGFVVEEESDLLRNHRDNYARQIFDPQLNRNTDQFLLRVRKPISQSSSR